MNELGKGQTPFLFFVDFEKSKGYIEPLHAVDPNKVLYAMNDDFIHYRNYEERNEPLPQQNLIQKVIPAKSKYLEAFSFTMGQLNFGNSFLTNLTCSTQISSDFTLEQLFHFAKAPYKLMLADSFISFSPESFIKIDAQGKVASFPMKGTIDAAIFDAENVILADLKEKYEHTTIVDLIRNDLSSICEKVWVEKFRYVERIKKQDGQAILQVSSEVCGYLESNWKESLGDIFQKILPAGSISGAPKTKTISIINEAEKIMDPNGKRDFYTGVFGVFDGECLDSAVLIRFIEKTNNGLVFKSGGGITTRSNADAEFLEMLSKIYVPIF